MGQNYGDFLDLKGKPPQFSGFWTIHRSFDLKGQTSRGAVTVCCPSLTATVMRNWSDWSVARLFTSWTTPVVLLIPNTLCCPSPSGPSAKCNFGCSSRSLACTLPIGLSTGACQSTTNTLREISDHSDSPGKGKTNQFAPPGSAAGTGARCRCGPAPGPAPGPGWAPTWPLPLQG